MDLIGDLVLSLPVVRSLKTTYPNAEIDLLAIPSSSKVVMNDPDLTEVIAYDPNNCADPKRYSTCKTGARLKHYGIVYKHDTMILQSVSLVPGPRYWPFLVVHNDALASDEKVIQVL